jgi:hypothetical protein
LTRHHSDEEVKEAIEKNYGAISAAARSLEVTPQALYKRINSSPELREVWDATRTRLFDTALLQLQRLVQSGDFPAIKHALTLAKDWDLLARKEVQADGNSAAQIGPELEPELERAIQRVLAAVAVAGEASLIRPDDVLPPGFEAPG